jgi:hypothetical protein
MGSVRSLLFFEQEIPTMTKKQFLPRETHSFSEIARKVSTGFASRTSEHDGTAARRWLFIMPRDWTWWVWLVTACLLLIGLHGYARSFSRRASTFNRSIHFIRSGTSIQGVPGPTSFCVHAVVDHLFLCSDPLVLSVPEISANTG